MSATNGSASQLPPEVIASIIEGYARSIRPAVECILIVTIMPAMLITLAGYDVCAVNAVQSQAADIRTKRVLCGIRTCFRGFGKTFDGKWIVYDTQQV